MSRKDFRWGVNLKKDCGSFNHKYLKRLIETMKILEADTVSMVYSPGDRYAFEFGDGTQVLIMNKFPKAEKFVSYDRV